MPWAPDYATTAELKSFLRIPPADTQDDAELASALTAASRAVDHSANRQFGSVTPVQARQFTARFDKTWCKWVVDVDDIHSVAGLLIFVDDDDDQVFDKPIDQFFLAPLDADDRGHPWTQVVVNRDSLNLPNTTPGGVLVSALWGWASVPGAIKAATILQASRFFVRRNAPFGVAGSPDVGSEIRLLSMVDPDVAVMVRPYRRQWGAA